MNDMQCYIQLRYSLQSMQQQRFMTGARKHTSYTSQHESCLSHHLNYTNCSTKLLLPLYLNSLPFPFPLCFFLSSLLWHFLKESKPELRKLWLFSSFFDEGHLALEEGHSALFPSFKFRAKKRQLL